MMLMLVNVRHLAVRYIGFSLKWDSSYRDLPVIRKHNNLGFYKLLKVLKIVKNLIKKIVLNYYVTYLNALV